MKGRPRYTKPDANHAEIRDGLRDLDFVVWDLKDLGGKVPDLLVISEGRCLPVEVKAPGKKITFTIAEEKGIEECAVEGVDWLIAITVKDVLEAFDVFREERELRQL